MNLELGHELPRVFLRNSTMECNTRCQHFYREGRQESHQKTKVQCLYVAAIFKLGSQYTSAKFKIGSKWVKLNFGMTMVPLLCFSIFLPHLATMYQDLGVFPEH